MELLLNIVAMLGMRRSLMQDLQLPLHPQP
jgi:hypothetical protein